MSKFFDDTMHGLLEAIEIEKGNAYAIKPVTPFITSKPLKRTPPTKENIAMVKFVDSHEFSCSSKDFVVRCKEK